MKSNAGSVRIRDAAIQAFSALGFHGTTTRDIATRAGMSPTAVYTHYHSKEDVLFEITKWGHLSILDVLNSSATDGANPSDRLGAAVYAFTAWHAEHKVTARIANYELRALNREHLDEIGQLRRKITSFLRSIVEDGMHTGQFRCKDSALTTQAIISLGIDISRWYQLNGVWSPDDVANHYRDLVLALVAAV